MRISFRSIELRDICEKESEAIKKYGQQVASSLQNRLADLIAATSISDLLLGNPRLVRIKNFSHYEIDLAEGLCLIIVADHVRNPILVDNDIDWTRVTYIQISDIIPIK